MSQQCIVNQVTIIPFTSSGLTTGIVSFLHTKVLLNGAASIVTFTTSEIGFGLYTLTITFPTTGTWSIFIEGQVLTFDVVDATLAETLKDLADEALGSWSWNKLTGTLSLLRRDGSALSSFTVTDSSNSASKERIS